MGYIDGELQVSEIGTYALIDDHLLDPIRDGCRYEEYTEYHERTHHHPDVHPILASFRTITCRKCQYRKEVEWHQTWKCHLQQGNETDCSGFIKSDPSDYVDQCDDDHECQQYEGYVFGSEHETRSGTALQRNHLKYSIAIIRYCTVSSSISVPDSVVSDSIIMCDEPIADSRLS